MVFTKIRNAIKNASNKDLKSAPKVLFTEAQKGALVWQVQALFPGAIGTSDGECYYADGLNDGFAIYDNIDQAAEAWATANYDKFMAALKTSGGGGDSGVQELVRDKSDDITDAGNDTGADETEDSNNGDTSVAENNSIEEILDEIDEDNETDAADSNDDQITDSSVEDEDDEDDDDDDDDDEELDTDTAD